MAEEEAEDEGASYVPEREYQNSIQNISDQLLVPMFRLMRTARGMEINISEFVEMKTELLEYVIRSLISFCISMFMYKVKCMKGPKDYSN